MFLCNIFVICLHSSVCGRVFTVASVVHRSPNSCSASRGRGSPFCVSAAGHQIITDPHTSPATSAMHWPYPAKVRQHVLTESRSSEESQAFVQRDAEQKKEGHFHSSLFIIYSSSHCSIYKNYLQIMPFLCSKGVSSLVFPFLSVLIKIVQTERQLYSRQTVWVHDRNSMLHADMHPFSVCVGISC